jgi:hypothetical protein
MKWTLLRSNWRQALAYGFCVLLSVFFFFVGVLLLVNPEAGGSFFGLALNETRNYSFHFTTAIRQIYLGVIILVLLWLRQFKALGVLLITIVLIPMTDFLIVFTAPGGTLSAAAAHLSGILVMGLGIYFFRKDHTLAKV